MSYTVLARRYRSRSFDEVVGQDAIARTLASAIEQGRVAHAYLFVGTRGVGKTSMARIFAKALNCPNDDPPEVAEAIMSGRDSDVIEIDAASNRGVDEARELIANSIYRPLRGPYKVYIIDEVHMLTREAFNALLKTMEEPPEHVKFILCTTEPHKVPATIQSRCQRFDFRNIPTQQIGEHLKAVIKQEKMKAEPELIHTVARMGAGSMRDALSLLDRLMAAVGPKDKMTLELLERLLGLPPRETLLAVVGSLAEGDAAAALERADELLAQGVTIDQALASLAEVLHDLLLLSTCGGETRLVELSAEAKEKAAALAGRFDPAGLVHMVALCESVQRSLRTSANPRAIFDALLVRLALTEKIAEVTALVQGAASGVPPAKKR
jgi:DNA polymerase-3 subunit gamma/tau